MKYRINVKNGDKLSALGYGAMRLPKEKQNKKVIDEKESVRILRLAYELGVNYFDTAYVYNDGESERVLGIAVAPFRGKIKLATKLPLRGIKNYEDFDKLFYTSLKRLGTNYIDYYLIHNIISFDQYVYIKGLGLDRWIEEKKSKGEIINIGFSFHGAREDFKKIIDSYDWEFCQIQYNYVDVDFQAGAEGLKYAAAKGLPVIIMEPLRGGALVNKLPKSAEKLFKEFDSALSNADWGLKWLYNQPEVTVVLSGMGSEDMVRANVGAADRFKQNCLSGDELEVYASVRREIEKAGFIPCTACGYCLPCPKGVAIPTCFSCYNSRSLTGYFQGVGNYVTSVGGLSGNSGFAGQCVGCGQCERKCPQGIKISEELKKVKRAYEIPLMKPIIKIVKKIIKL